GDRCHHRSSRAETPSGQASTGASPRSGERGRSMNSVESAFQRLRDANPEPNPSALVASIRSRAAGPPHLKGNEHMTTEHVMLRHDDRAQPPARPRRWMPAVAAAAIVVLAALPFALGGGDEFA